MVALGITRDAHSCLFEQLAGLFSSLRHVGHLMIGMACAEALAGQKRIFHHLSILILTQEVEGAGVEMQCALTGSHDSYLLTSFLQGDAAGQTCQTATYYNHVVLHLAISFPSPASWFSPQRSS